MKWRIHRCPVQGALEVPGDKSIAHRALMLAALAEGESHIDGLPGGEDVLSTARCMTALGADISLRGVRATVRAGGELQAPSMPLDAGNSGTTMRLLCGILAGQPFTSQLVGDASLSRRPMGRVIEPLSRMGAHIQSDAGRAPLHIQGTQLHGASYILPVASAQVKSAVLLAGMFAAGTTEVIEPLPARDHTERLFGALGVPLSVQDGRISVSRGRPHPFTLCVPGDISSAAFWLVAAAAGLGSVTVRRVGINPTRSAILDVLGRMGASVEVNHRQEEGGEPVADVTVHGPVTRSTTIEGDEVPRLVDELPVLAMLATQVTGTTTVRGAAELRVKETDRIATLVAELSRMGADLDELPDGLVIRGRTELRGATVRSHGDHRLAMTLTIAGTLAEGETVVEGAEAVDVSYPGFADALRSLGGQIERE